MSGTRRGRSGRSNRQIEPTSARNDATPRCRYPDNRPPPLQEERRRTTLTTDDIKGLVALVTQHRVAELSVQVGKNRVRIVGMLNGTAVRTVADIPGWDCPVCSPTVGSLRWLHRDGHALLPGERVARGAVLGHVEALGVRHEIQAPVAGVVASQLVKDNQPVEFGQALLIVRVTGYTPG